MSRNPRVIVIDQDSRSRGDVQKMLALSGFAILGEAGYGIEASALAKETEPDVVVIAVEEPLARALQTVQAVTDLLPESPVVAYSSISDPALMRRALLAGVKDYLLTPVKEEVIGQSIHAVIAQEEKRRARVSGEASEPVASGIVLTVFGAKGGIGKTTLATNLATVLVDKAQQSVVVIDLDTRFGDVAILMDIPVERSIADLALPEEEITRDLVQSCIYTHASGVAVLPAPIRPTDWRNVHGGHIEKIVWQLTRMYDYVILDTPGAFNDIVAKGLEMATLVLLVATVDMASLKDALLAIEMLKSWNFPQDKLKVVINSTNDANLVQPQEVKKMLGKDVFWAIPYDRAISMAGQLGMPVVTSKPQSKAAESFVGMAYALSGVRGQPSVSRERSRGGLFGRILGQLTDEKTEMRSGV